MIDLPHHSLDRQKTERIRFEYEYAGKTKQYLINKYNLVPDSLDKVMKDQDWVQRRVDPMDPKAVNAYYSDARKRISVEAVQRAITLWLDINDIEDAVLKDLQEKLEDAQSKPELRLTVSELNKIMKMVDTLKNATKIYNEAFEVPAMADRDIKALLDNMEPSDIADLTRYIEENGIPVPEIEIEDI